MADSSDKILQKLLNIVSGSVIDVARFLQQLALNAKDEKERFALRNLCMDVEDGKAKISVINTEDVPFETLESFANDNDWYIHSLQSLGENYDYALVPDDAAAAFEMFIEEYKEKEAASIEEIEKEYEKERILNRKKEKEILPEPKEEEEIESVPEFPEDAEEEKPQKKLLIKRSKEPKKETSKKQKESSFLYNKSSVSLQKKYTETESHENKSENRSDHRSEHHTSSHEKITTHFFHSSKVTAAASGRDMEKTATSSQVSGIRTSPITDKLYTKEKEAIEKTQSSQIYKISTNNSYSSRIAFEKTQSAIGAAILQPANEIKNNDGIKEVNKYLPVYQIASGICSSSAANLLEKTRFATVSLEHEHGRFIELNSFLKKNGVGAIDFYDEQSFLNSVNKLMGNGGGKSSLAQMGLNPFRMTEKEMANILINNHGLIEKEAKKIAKDIFYLRDQDNLIKTMRAKTQVAFVGVKLASREMFKDNQGVTAVMDGVSAIQSVFDITKYAGSAFQSVGHGATAPIRKVGTGIKKVTAKHIGQPIAKNLKSSGLFRSASRFGNTTKKTIQKITNPVKNFFVKPKIRPMIQQTSNKLLLKTLGPQKYNTTTIFFKKMGKAGKKIAAPFKTVDKGVKYLSNKVTTKSLNILKIFEKLKKWIYIFVGGALIAELILGLYITILVIILSVATGFFEYEQQPTDNPLDTITGRTYLSLVEAEKVWANSLMLLGSVQNVTNSFVSSFSPTKVDDLLYTVDDIEIPNYAVIQGWIYDSGSNTIKALDKPPFPGAPVEAYKPIGIIDGGVEVTFKNGTGEASLRTSNIQDILSMSPVFFQQNFAHLKTQENGNLATKLFRAWNSISTASSNLKKNLKNKWNQFVGENSIFRLSLFTVEDFTNSLIERAYAESLFHASHKECFELEVNIFPVNSTPIEDHGVGYTGPLTYCPDAPSGGCHIYDNFYYLEDGSLSGDNATPAGDDVKELDDKPCTSLQTDAEKEASPCWVKEELQVQVNGKNITTHEYLWLCAGGHSGQYCGGHLTINSTGIIYTMTQEQIDGDNIVGKVPEDNKPYGADITEESIDEAAIDSAIDIFDIDMAIKHLGSPKTWNGWTKSNIEWAANIYRQDWDELYGIQSGASVMFEDSFTASEIAKVLSELSGVSVTSLDVLNLLNGKINTGFGSLSYKQAVVVAQAYYWVGNIGYDQFHHSDPLQKGGFTDCSGFASRVWQSAGINIPVCTSRTLYSMSVPINDAALIPGDLLVRNGHVVIFVGRADNGDYIFIESNVFPGRGIRGPGNIFCKTRSLSAFQSMGYQMIPISNY